MSVLIPAELAVLGIGLEITPGSVVAPTNYFRATSLKPVINQAYLPDQSMQGSMAKTYDEIAGVNYATYEADGSLYADEIGWWLASILGDLAVTGSGDPYTNVFSLLNTPPGQPSTYTLTDYNGNNARTFGSARASSLAVKFSADQLATVTAMLTAMNFATASAPTASYPTGTRALPSWKAAVSINSLTTPIVTDMEWDIKRTVTPVFALDDSQTAKAIYTGGDTECTGSMTLAYDSAGLAEAVYGYYLAGTVVPLALDLLSTESAAHEVKFATTKAVIDSCTIERTAGKYVELACTFTTVANTTDAGVSAGKSPVKVTTKAQLASGTYI